MKTLAGRPCHTLHYGLLGFCGAEAFFEAVGDVEGNQAGEVIGVVLAELNDLLDERAGGEAVLAGGHEENGFNSAHDQIRGRNFEFGVKVHVVANAAKNDPGPQPPRKLHGQP